MVKQLIPAPLRLQARIWQRQWQDLRQGQRDRFAAQPSSAAGQADNGNPALSHQWSITQPIPNTSHSANKRVNLAQAIAQLNNVIVQPQQILSFWHLVGAPTERRGYCEGRAIVGDRLSSEIGGGLCQLSGMLYWLGLQAGLEVIERHPHSQDLYTDATRYAPLGSDATVVYGYKDLRLQNNQAEPLSFRFELGNDAVTVGLWAPHSVERWSVSFEELSASEVSKQGGSDPRQNHRGKGVWIKTMRSLPQAAVSKAAPERVSQTFYRRSH